MKYRYNIYRPSGNDTALVLGLPENKQDIFTINDLIQGKHQNVEQVGFVYQKKNEYYLRMAGGEFCGNATRSAVFLFLDEKEGNMYIHSSGVEQLLNGGIDTNGNSWVEVPVKSDFIWIKRQLSLWRE